MSSDTTTEAPPQTETDEAPEPEAPDEGEHEGEHEEHDGPGREAARYRRRLRSAEAERDQLASTVEALQRAEVERIATATVAKPEALWLAGVALGDLLTDDGGIDADKVTAAATAAVETLGLARPRRGNIVPGEGNNPGTVATGDRMAAALDGLR